MDQKFSRESKNLFIEDDRVGLRMERGRALLKESQHIQSKITELLSLLKGGVFWSAQHQQRLSSLLAQRKTKAAELGMLLITHPNPEILMQVFYPQEKNEQLSLWEKVGQSGDWLKSILSRLKAPNNQDGSLEAVQNEFRDIDSIVQGIFSWSTQPATHQTSVLEHIVARLRNIQTGSHASFFEESVRRLFYKMTDYSKRHTPGFIHGMSLNHKPREETWFEDARQTWSSLQRMSHQGELEEIIFSLKENLNLNPINWDKIEALLLKSRHAWQNDNIKRLLLPHSGQIAKRDVLQELSKNLAHGLDY